MTDTEALQAVRADGEAGSQALAPPTQTVPPPHPELQRAIEAANAKNGALAERLTRNFLDTHPSDVIALKLLGELLMQKGTVAGAHAAEGLFIKCLELSPGFVAARHCYAKLLVKMAKFAPARTQIELLLGGDPQSATLRSLMAYTLGQIGEYEEALKYHEAVLADFSHEPRTWMVYANDLRAAGRTEDCIAAYRRVLEIDPEFAGAYWTLGDLKTFRFSPADVAHIQEQLKRPQLSVANRVYLNFALGKSFEDEGKYEEAFASFRTANALQRSIVAYDPRRTAREFAGLKSIFTAEFFAQRPGVGCQAADPIFIVGLPRSGSTLVEQILASHSAVEGTRELPYLQLIAAQLRSEFERKLTGLTSERFAQLGERVVEGARPFRRLGRSRFIDKMPNNFAYVGLIHTILPKAKIIDVRRNPLDCCLANFKQLFFGSYAHSYDLADLAKYYNAYLDLMAHYDTVLPGKVHRVLYEDLVEEPEAEIRKLLAYLEVPFEEQCLRFYESGRAVRTASSEQVRMPIFKHSVGGWRKYEQWIAPLKKELGVA
ncbi:MAG: tetratricopeptide repeat-containing sulfotransferase family protein [Rhizomicrobium sp.]